MEANETNTATLEVSPEVAAKAQDMQKKEAERFQKLQAKTKENHPHALVETMTWDSTAKKFKCRIKCIDCGDTSRWVYTSDLFQVKRCNACAAKAKKALKVQKKAEMDAARELIKSGALNK